MKIKIIQLIVFLIINSLFTGNVIGQDSNDPVKKMYQMFLANTFNASKTDSKNSISSIPVYINNFSDCSIKDSTYHPEIAKYINFPREIKARSSETGFIYYGLFYNLVKKNPNDLYIKYNFENSYRTPFVFHILSELPGFPKPPQSTHDGIKTAINVTSQFISYIPEVGEIISFFIDIFSFAIFKALEYSGEEIPMEFYTLAYTYTNNRDIDVPQTIFYADSTGNPSTNACYMFHLSPIEPSDTAYVVENIVVWPQNFTNSYTGNHLGYISSSIVVNIYNTWEYFSVKLKKSAGMIKKYSPDYAVNPELKLIVDKLNSLQSHEIAKLYSGSYNSINAAETDLLLDDFFKKKINLNSDETIKRIKNVLNIIK